MPNDDHRGPINKIKTTPNTCLWAVLTLLMLIIALFFGLMPRKWPIANDVQWTSETSMLRFQNTGIAFVDDLRAVWLNRPPWPLTIEMAVTPASFDRRGFSPILVMHDGSDRRQLAIWQYGTSLIVMNGDDYDNKQRRPRVVGRDVFLSRQTYYLTITSGERGTHLYVDGNLAAANVNWKLAIPAQGTPLRLVLGNSVYGKYGWAGDLHGLAISGAAIAENAVRLRFDRWAAEHNFGILKQDSTMLLFTFNKKTDDGFADESGGDQTLLLPSRMTVLRKTFLSPPWQHLKWSPAVIGDMVLNVVGFIPMGLVFYGFVQCFSRLFIKYKGRFALILCALLSCGIELAQAWIPTRHSTLLDLTLNTCGAMIGIGLWRLARDRNNQAPGGVKRQETK